MVLPFCGYWFGPPIYTYYVHEDKLSKNLRLSQTKIIKKVRFLIYIPKNVLWSERNFVLIFYCLFYDFHGTLEKSAKYAILNPVKV